MKNLFLVRHSNALKDDPLIEDIKRPLIEKGIERAIKVGELIKSLYPVPDLIITSHATRALQTASILSKVLNYPETGIEKDILLFRCHYSYMIEKILMTENEVNSLMLVGHNPVITYAASHFLGKEIDYLLPCGFVFIKFDTESWEEAGIPSVNNIVDPRIL